MPASSSTPDRCRDPECGIPLVGRHADPVPPGHARHGGRGLCKSSYDQARKANRLHDYPRVLYTAPEVLDRYRQLRAAGYTQRQVAVELGMTVGGLRSALARAGVVRAGPRGAGGWAHPQHFDLDTRDEGE